MPATSSSGTRSSQPQRTLLTPSASPVAPPDRPPTKRPRLRSTPSSCVSATPSNSNESMSSTDVDSARRASTLRVLSVWAQLAERYNKRLDEDDIIDLHSGAIIKDRGMCRNASKDYLFGHFAHPDGDQDPDQDQEDSEQDDDDDELNAHPPSEAVTDDDVPISKKELLRGVPPLSATNDAEDLREFLEAEKRRREIACDEEDEEDLSPAKLCAIRKALEEQSREEEAAAASQDPGATDANHSPEREADITPMRSSVRVPLDDESEDELSLWVHDESTALHPVVRAQSEQDMHQVEREIIELTDSDSDSDKEFEAMLTRPPRFTQAPPLSVSPPQRVQQSLQLPPDSERGRPESRARPKPKVKSKAEITPKSESRPRQPPVLRKPETVLAQSRKSSISRKSYVAPGDEESDRDVIHHISSAHKGKGKEIQTPVDVTRREKTPKSLGAASRGLKRKRIASSATSGPLPQSPGGHSPVTSPRPLSPTLSKFHTTDPKNPPRGRRKPTSQSSMPPPQLDDTRKTLDRDVSGSTRLGCGTPGHLRSFPSLSETPQPTLSALSYIPPEPKSIQPTLHSYNPNRTPAAEPPITITHPHTRRHPPMLSSPNQPTPDPSLAGHVPPPMDPVQAQQAYYLLAQAMQQLSYLLSATVSPCAAYTSDNPGRSWQHPPHPSHTAYSTPIHHPTHFRPLYHTPSSSKSHSELPPSSPVLTSVSPAEERHSLVRGRSKSLGRRVSFKDDEEVTYIREYNIQPKPHHSGPKKRKKPLEEKRASGKEKPADVFDDAFRDDPPEVARGRTPGPPNYKTNEVSRGKSLDRR